MDDPVSDIDVGLDYFPDKHGDVLKEKIEIPFRVLQELDPVEKKIAHDPGNKKRGKDTDKEMFPVGRPVEKAPCAVSQNECDDSFSNAYDHGVTSSS